VAKHIRLCYPSDTGFAAVAGKQERVYKNPALAAENNKEKRHQINLISSIQNIKLIRGRHVSFHIK